MYVCLRTFCNRYFFCLYALGLIIVQHFPKKCGNAAMPRSCKNTVFPAGEVVFDSLARLSLTVAAHSSIQSLYFAFVVPTRVLVSLFKGAISQGSCCFRSILCLSRNLVPLPTHKMPLQGYSSVSTVNKNRHFWWFLQAQHLISKRFAQHFHVSIHFHPCRP